MRCPALAAFLLLSLTGCPGGSDDAQPGDAGGTVDAGNVAADAGSADATPGQDTSASDTAPAAGCGLVCLSLDGKVANVVNPSAKGAKVTGNGWMTWRLGTIRGASELVPGEAFVLLTAVSLTKDFTKDEVTPADLTVLELDITHTSDAKVNLYHVLNAKSLPDIQFSASGGKIQVSAKGVAKNMMDSTTVQVDFQAHGLETQ
jgi:hypothetical protein